MYSLLKRARDKESGFTLIELLVVMIIIAVLAAVAIPIFLNQQKTAKDTAVKMDVRNVAMSIQGLLVYTPDATEFAISQRGGNVTAAGRDANGLATLSAASLTSNILASNITTGENQAKVTVAGKTSNVNLTKGVVIAVEETGEPGGFLVYGWSNSAKTYSTKALVFDSTKGGLQKTTVAIPSNLPNTDGGTGSGPTNPDGGSTPAPTTPTNPNPAPTTPEPTPTTPDPTPTTPAPPAYTVSGDLKITVIDTVPGEYKYTLTWTPVANKSIYFYGVAFTDYDKTGKKIWAASSTAFTSSYCTKTQCTFTTISDKSNPDYVDFKVTPYESTTSPALTATTGKVTFNK